jgi:DNA polymerase III epsilon subunit-like protein
MGQPKIANQDRDLLFLDSETTGLDQRVDGRLVHEAIEWAAIRTKPDGKTVVATFEARLVPRRPELFDDYAKRVNGYDEAEWAATALDPATVAAELAHIADGTILIGQNVGFDIGFLEKTLAENNVKPTWHYHKVDVMNLAWPFIKKGLLPGLSLNQLAEPFGLSQPEPHRAMSDVLLVQRVYQLLMERLSVVTLVDG